MLNRTELFEKIGNKANELGYDLIKVGSYHHKDDHFLKTVICRKKESDAGYFSDSYVCWIYNINDNGFTSGHYVKSLEDAQEKFNDRVSRI